MKVDIYYECAKKISIKKGLQPPFRKKNIIKKLTPKASSRLEINPWGYLRNYISYKKFVRALKKQEYKNNYWLFCWGRNLEIEFCNEWLHGVLYEVQGGVRRPEIFNLYSIGKTNIKSNKNYISWKRLSKRKKQYRPL